jgi:hypothetical protein
VSNLPADPIFPNLKHKYTYILLQESDIHLYYQVKCHLMLAALADIPPVAEEHFNEADRLCTELYESRKAGEEEEILTYRAIITGGKTDLGPEMKQWKMEEGMYSTRPAQTKIRSSRYSRSWTRSIVNPNHIPFPFDIKALTTHWTLKSHIAPNTDLLQIKSPVSTLVAICPLFKLQ